jgi:hypothetical protein
MSQTSLLINGAFVSSFAPILEMRGCPGKTVSSIWSLTKNQVSMSSVRFLALIFKGTMVGGVNSEHYDLLDHDNLEAHPYNEEPDCVVNGTGSVFAGSISLFQLLCIFI